MPKQPITVDEFNERGITKPLQELLWQAFAEEVDEEIERLTMVKRVAETVHGKHVTPITVLESAGRGYSRQGGTTLSPDSKDSGK